MNRHSEAHVRLVRSVVVHGVEPAHPRKRIWDIHPDDILEERPHHAFEHIQNVILLHETHLAVNLGEFRLAVCPQVFVAETSYDLEITVISCHHQQLLECLRRLRQCIELTWVHPGRHHEVASSFRRGFDEVWCFDFHEVMCIQIVADLVGKPVPEGKSLLERIPAQVQVTVFRADVLAAIAFILYGERRSH